MHRGLCKKFNNTFLARENFHVIVSGVISGYMSTINTGRPAEQTYTRQHDVPTSAECTCVNGALVVTPAAVCMARLHGTVLHSVYTAKVNRT